jgi:phosphoglycolate phosphatase-like HAD superfamily hydrolase
MAASDTTFLLSSMTNAFAAVALASVMTTTMTTRMKNSSQVLQPLPFIDLIDTGESEPLKTKIGKGLSNRFMAARSATKTKTKIPKKKSVVTPQTPPKLHIVFDMDSTMLYCFLEGFSDEVDNAAASPDFEVDFACSKGIVFLRPGLLEVIKTLKSQGHTLYVFTAGTKGYAKPILDKLESIFGGKIFEQRWYRHHTVAEGQREYPYVKDLSKLSCLPLKRTVLVDDNSLVFMKNPFNGILVNSFYGEADDRTLYAVEEELEILVNVLQQQRNKSKKQDVRPHLMAKFRIHNVAAGLESEDSNALSRTEDPFS